MNVGKALALAVLGLSIGAAIGYLVAGDTRRAIYWAGAAIVTAAVTF